MRAALAAWLALSAVMAGCHAAPTAAPAPARDGGHATTSAAAGDKAHLCPLKAAQLAARATDASPLTKECAQPKSAGFCHACKCSMIAWMSVNLGTSKMVDEKASKQQIVTTFLACDPVFESILLSRNTLSFDAWQALPQCPEHTYADCTDYTRNDRVLERLAAPFKGAASLPKCSFSAADVKPQEMAGVAAGCDPKRHSGAALCKSCNCAILQYSHNVATRLAREGKFSGDFSACAGELTKALTDAGKLSSDSIQALTCDEWNTQSASAKHKACGLAYAPAATGVAGPAGAKPAVPARATGSG